MPEKDVFNSPKLAISDVLKTFCLKRAKLNLKVQNTYRSWFPVLPYVQQVYFGKRKMRVNSLDLEEQEYTRHELAACRLFQLVDNEVELLKESETNKPT